MPRGGTRSGAGRKAVSETDISALVDVLTPVKVGRGNYTAMDRYRDFNRVFNGTPEGKRVLAQIVDLCEGKVVIENELDNHALLAARAWTRRQGTQILSWASVPPRQAVTQAQPGETPERPNE